MAIAVYLLKRYLKGRKRNGQREYRYALRWEDPDTGKFACESTATSDRTQAEDLRSLKWAQINGLTPDEPLLVVEPEPPKGPPWEEALSLIEKAMRADNLRPSYIADTQLTLRGLSKMFPETEGPADVTEKHAAEYKRRRAAKGTVSPWTIKGDLATLKAAFGKWLGAELELLSKNPFAKTKAPKCDEPEVRIVSAEETAALFQWLGDRWNNWRLPLVYLEVASLLGCAHRPEIASIRSDDLLADGYVRVAAQRSKTRGTKYGWLPDELFSELRACGANGCAFGRFADDLRRLLILWRKQPHHAARVADFDPKRLVGWLQDELQRFHESRQTKENEAAEKDEREPVVVPTFTLHDFRRTAITGMQMAGTPEKEAATITGVTPEVMRRHYDKLDRLVIAKRNVERRLTAEGRIQSPQSLRALRAAS